MKSRFVSFLVLVIGVALVVSLSRSLWKMRSAQERHSSLQQAVEDEKARKGDLEKIVSWRRSLDFVEQEARNRLQMVKEGEKMVVLPDKGVQERNNSANTVFGFSEGSKEKHLQSWKQWADLFGLID